MNAASDAKILIQRYGNRAGDAAIELINVARQMDDDDLAVDFARILQQIREILPASGDADSERA